MASIRCERCSGPLPIQADGSATVCPKCGTVYSPDKIRKLLQKQKAEKIASSAEQLTLQHCRKVLKDLTGSKCDSTGAKKELGQCHNELEALSPEQRNAIAGDLASAVGAAAFNLKSVNLWQPFLQGIVHIRGFLPTKSYHAVMSQALDCMSDFVLSPVEKALVAWHKTADSNRTESGAVELLRRCNKTTEQVLRFLGFALADQKDVDFERSLTDLFERLDRLSWDTSEITCSRPVPHEAGKYERYSFFSTSSYLPDKTALSRNRSIVENRSNQMKQQADQLRRKRIDAYWQEHPDKRAALQSRWADLRMQIAALRRKLNLCPQIGRMQEIQKRLNELQPQIAALSIFRQREKNALKEEQNALKMEFCQLDQEFMDLDLETRTQISVLEEELTDVSNQLEGRSEQENA